MPCPKIPSKGTQPCSPANFSLSEGGSKIIVPNISAMSNILVLCKKNHPSSAWNAILLINKGDLTEMNSGAKRHFYISDHGLAIKNASKELTGQYQLAYYINDSCTHQFFLDFRGSEGTYYSPYWAIGVVLSLISTAFLAICLYTKCKRRKKERSEPNPENESLPLSTPKDYPREMEESSLPAPRTAVCHLDAQG